MQHQPTTSLTHTQFATLLTALTEHLIWAKPAEKPRKPYPTPSPKNHPAQLPTKHHPRNPSPPLRHLTAHHFTNHQHHRKALTQVLKPLNRPLTESLKAPGSLVINGTLIPTWNCRSQGKTNYSGKHKRTGFNHQVIYTLEGKLLAITDPLPGARHDTYAFRKHELGRLLNSSTLADKGYVGLGLATPTRRKPGQKLAMEQKRNNRVINRFRSVVERVIGNIKTWRVLHTGFRRPLGSCSRVFSVVCGLIFFVAGYPL